MKLIVDKIQNGFLVNTGWDNDEAMAFLTWEETVAWIKNFDWEDED